MAWASDLFRVAVLQRNTVNGATFVTVNYVISGASDCLTVAEEWAVAWGKDGNNLQQGQSTDIAYDEVQCSNPSGLYASASSDFSAADNQSGGAGADPVPPQVAAVLTWKSAIGGRQGRGRTFFPGLPDSSLADHKAQWATGGPPTLQTRAETWFSNMTSGATISDVVIAHRKTEDFSTITGVIFRYNYLGTIRRRAERFM